MGARKEIRKVTYKRLPNSKLQRSMLKLHAHYCKRNARLSFDNLFDHQKEAFIYVKIYNDPNLMYMILRLPRVSTPNWVDKIVKVIKKLGYFILRNNKKYRKTKKKVKKRIKNCYLNAGEKINKIFNKIQFKTFVFIANVTNQVKNIKQYLPKFSFIKNLFNKKKRKPISVKSPIKVLLKSVKSFYNKMIYKTKLFINTNKTYLPKIILEYYLQHYSYINTFSLFLIPVVCSYPFFKYLNYEIANYFEFLDPMLKIGLFRYLIEDCYKKTLLTFILLVFSEIYIYKSNQTKNVKSTYTDRNKYTPQVFERIIPVLYYLILWIGLCSNKLDLAKTAFKNTFPKNRFLSKHLFKGIIAIWLHGVRKIIGFKYGIIGYFFYYLNYQKVVRNNKVIPYFIRYHFMASQLNAVIIEFIDTVGMFILKYSEYIDPLNNKKHITIFRYYAYCISTIWIFYCMIMCLMGLLIPSDFLNAAIFWHVGVDRRV